MSEISMTTRVTGQVQGVAYRNWARSRATALGLRGWVRNDVSGAVIAQIEGDKAAVQQLLSEMWSGPGAASVRDVQSRATQLQITDSGFKIRR
ncbi:acylphosphatase [Cognatishimia sp. SS12]|uniref:acylphosphatase n=1 Tax=Cognatishimia sp. SS12 TaxID=2979465 RepID=UPI00232AEF64|nr:acylphosphatase [Cognatishimia sp. SS12]MDC0739038.1 acylphosphatase [Cognatishimia sp. SS12]